MKRLHRYVWIIVLLFSARMGLAQQHDAPFYDSTKATDVLDINFHTGLGVSSLLQNYASIIPGLSDFLLSPGCIIRNGVEVHFEILNSFGLGTGMDFNINNSRIAMSLVDNANGSISSIYIANHFYDIMVPVFASWRFNIGRRMKWNVDMGIYFSHGIGGTMKASGYVSGDNSLGQPVVTHASYESDYFRSDRPYVNGVRKDDWGPRIATGLIYKSKYTFNVVFQVSAKNLSINQGMLDAKYRNLNLVFQFGYNI